MFFLILLYKVQIGEAKSVNKKTRKIGAFLGVSHFDFVFGAVFGPQMPPRGPEMMEYHILKLIKFNWYVARVNFICSNIKYCFILSYAMRNGTALLAPHTHNDNNDSSPACSCL